VDENGLPLGLYRAWELSRSVPDSHVIGEDHEVLAEDDQSAGLVLEKIFGPPDKWVLEQLPRDDRGAWGGGHYMPLLWPNRRIRLRVAMTAPTVAEPEPRDWRVLFDGLIGDDIDTDGP